MFDKYKSLLQDDMLFYGLLIVLIGVASFGLGRWSAVGEGPQRQTAAIVVTDTTTKEAAAPTSTNSVPTDPAATVEMAGQYVGSRNSDKYHLPWCPGAQRIKVENKVWFEDIAAAEAQGYAPAANCPGL